MGVVFCYSTLQQEQAALARVATLFHHRPLLLLLLLRTSWYCNTSTLTCMHTRSTFAVSHIVVFYWMTDKLTWLLVGWCGGAKKRRHTTDRMCVSRFMRQQQQQQQDIQPAAEQSDADDDGKTHIMSRYQAIPWSTLTRFTHRLAVRACKACLFACLLGKELLPACCVSVSAAKWRDASQRFSAIVKRGLKTRTYEVWIT